MSWVIVIILLVILTEFLNSRLGDSTYHSLSLHVVQLPMNLMKEYKNCCLLI